MHGEKEKYIKEEWGVSVKKMVCSGDLSQQNNKKANKGPSDITLRVSSFPSLSIMFNTLNAVFGC